MCAGCSIEKSAGRFLHTYLYDLLGIFLKKVLFYVNAFYFFLRQEDLWDRPANICVLGARIYHTTHSKDIFSEPFPDGCAI